jgi:hypothetical protein
MTTIVPTARIERLILLIQGHKVMLDAVFVSSHTRLKLFKPTVCVLKLNELVEFIRDRETKRAGGRRIKKGNEVYCPRKSYAGTQSPLGSKEPSELFLSPHTVFVSSKLQRAARSV